ncbi:hypothetical protein JZ751_015888, partial [Albula glossodonta]
MAELLSSEVPLKRKKTASQSSSLGDSSKQGPVGLLSSTKLLLQIPPQINPEISSLPVWENVHGAEVEAQWCVTPYCINIQITPFAARKAETNAMSRVHPLPQTTSGAALSQSAPRVQNTPHSCRLFGPPPSRDLTPAVVQPQPCQACSTIFSGGRQAAESYYCQSSDDILICDRFLTGRCRLKLTCRLHHTPYPFHWQLRCSDTHQWVSVSPSAQVTLEKLYCDPDQETIWLYDKQDSFTLKFETMTVGFSKKYDRGRRLSNSSDPVRNPYFPAEWKIHWWSDYKWEEYRKDLSEELLEAMETKKKRYQFHIGKQMYEVDFSGMTQRNVTTGFIRRVRRRPTFRSPFSLKSNLKTVVLVDTSTPVSQDLSRLNVDPLQEFSSWYPPVWTLTPDQGYSLVELPPNTKAYQCIHSMFHQTMSENKVEIISIQQVQNVFQWDKYQRQKQHMQSHSPDQAGSLERHLFHGTTEDSAKEICQNNFDPRVSGKNGVAYGQGSYFARDSSNSHSYTFALATGERRMFLAKVLVGKMATGMSKHRRPPLLNTQKPGFQRYDSCTDFPHSPTTFVVFDSCQCYPYYLITYKE